MHGLQMKDEQLSELSKKGGKFKITRPACVKAHVKIRKEVVTPLLLSAALQHRLCRGGRAHQNHDADRGGYQPNDDLFYTPKKC